MGHPSLRKNFFYKALLTVANPIMGMITFPYISRVLGVEKVGLVNFVDNTISYFLLFATMGIGTIGVRAIAAAKESQEQLNKTYSNILGLNMLFTMAVLLIYNIAIFLIPGFSQYSELFFIGNAKILFSSLLIEWFFNGIENFKFITIRSLLIRALFILSVFLFVKDTNDYLLYFILTTSVVVFNSAINLLYSHKFVRISFRELFSTRFLKENLMLGVYSILTSTYLTFNVMYLGLTSSNVEVGYYTSAYKLYHLILSVFTAFTSVMLPRMSHLVSKGDKKQFDEFIDKSITFVSLFSIPVVICGIILAPEIIDLLCGDGYEGAILPMRIIMPSILLVGISQVIAVQTLMPKKKDNVLLSASILGAVVAVLLNILIVPRLQSIGSAIVMLSSEVVVTTLYLIYVQISKVIEMSWKRFIRPVITTIPCVLICLWIKSLELNSIFTLLVSVPLSVAVYTLLNSQNIFSILLTKQINK